MNKERMCVLAPARLILGEAVEREEGYPMLDVNLKKY